MYGIGLVVWSVLGIRCGYFGRVKGVLDVRLVVWVGDVHFVVVVEE